MLRLHISASSDTIRSLLVQTSDKNVEQAVYYLSYVLIDTEQRYTSIDKICLALYFSCVKLRYSMLLIIVEVLCETGVIKYMLSRPIIKGKIAKWSLTILEFHLRYIPQKVIE